MISSEEETSGGVAVEKAGTDAGSTKMTGRHLLQRRNSEPWSLKPRVPTRKPPLINRIKQRAVKSIPVRTTVWAFLKAQGISLLMLSRLQFFAMRLMPVCCCSCCWAALSVLATVIGTSSLYSLYIPDRFIGFPVFFDYQPYEVAVDVQNVTEAIPLKFPLIDYPIYAVPKSHSLLLKDKRSGRPDAISSPFLPLSLSLPPPFDVAMAHVVFDSYNWEPLMTNIERTTSHYHSPSWIKKPVHSNKRPSKSVSKDTWLEEENVAKFASGRAMADSSYHGSQSSVLNPFAEDNIEEINPKKKLDRITNFNSRITDGVVLQIHLNLKLIVDSDGRPIPADDRHYRELLHGKEQEKDNKNIRSNRPVMITAEIFDSDGQLIAETTKPLSRNIGRWQRFQKWFLFPFQSNYEQDVEFLLFEDFPYVNQKFGAMMRIRIQPPMELLKANLEVELQLSQIGELLRRYRHPVLVLLTSFIGSGVFGSVSIGCGCCFFFIFGQRSTENDQRSADDEESALEEKSIFSDLAGGSENNYRPLMTKQDSQNSMEESEDQFSLSNIKLRSSSRLMTVLESDKSPSSPLRKRVSTKY
eukprot:GHVP01053218.1.p1 GENE.GHVP01053218.1~~GHVP01053218.1.p1  ORF type:complete len:583 (+),score=91.41 GHVP01053218.1:29-1777(+)